MKIKVYGADGKSRVMTANTFADIYKISQCYKKWEYII
jgi:hypothetical protein